MVRQTSKQRVLADLAYEPFDRFPTKHYGTPEINAALMAHFKTSTYEELLEVVGDDFRHVDPRYIGPELKRHPDGSWDGIWGERYKDCCFGEGTYPEACHLPYKDITETYQLEGLRFPGPDWFDYSGVRQECRRLSDFAVVVGSPGCMDFINGIARCRGVEQVLLDIALEDPVFLALMERRHAFYMGLFERTLAAAAGGIDIVGIGEDYGSQNGLLISPLTFEKLFAPKLAEYIGLAHAYGAKAMMHCCGSCRDLIPRFIDLGLDILEVVQVDASRMDIRDIHAACHRRMALCGSISVQSTLPFGSAADVRREVEERKTLFSDGGMIIAATHDIQVGTPVKNILEMYRTLGSLR